MSTKLPNPIAMAYVAAAGLGVFIAYKVSQGLGAAAQAVKEGAGTAVDVAAGNYDPVGDYLGWHFYLGTNGVTLGDWHASLNPANPDNAVNQGVSAAGQAVTKDPGWNLGGWVWELTHPGQVAAEKGRTGS